PEAVPGDTALRMASQNGARAMGFAGSGVIAPGMAADITLIDMDKPHLLPRHNLVANVVHSAKAADVDHVLVDGKLIYRKGELLTLDEAKIKTMAERGALNMVNRDMRSVREYKA
ncbi:MAG: amidohydrolase family protein, partial [Chloroflexota bacterium]